MNNYLHITLGGKIWKNDEKRDIKTLNFIVTKMFYYYLQNNKNKRISSNRKLQHEIIS